jgi:AbrB family looped-hinge helix DNA binding protein
MPKGQISLPVDIRQKLKIQTGDKIALVYENGRVFLINPAIYAMDTFAKTMEGEWEKADIKSEDDILNMCREIREEVEGR